jgi:phosphoribosylformimino-5-aminoimidazole carboxamide ribotide isomerase
MKLFPAIDLKMGEAVRLLRGDFNQKEVVSASPEAALSLFLGQKAKQIHLVDLDGALGDRKINRLLVKKLCKMAKSAGVPIQMGGGIKTLSDFEDAIEMGVSQVVIGSMVVHDFELFKDILSKHKRETVVGLDVEGGGLKTGGWLKKTNTSPVEMAKALNALGLRRVVVTDISRDGTLLGPNIALCQTIKSVFGGEVIVSGGIGSDADLKAVASAGLDGAVIGKALYAGRIALTDWEVSNGL